MTVAQLRTLVRRGECIRLMQGVYAEGNDAPSSLDEALGLLVAVDGVASGSLAAEIYDFDSVELRKPYVTVDCTSGFRRSGIRRRDLKDLPVQFFDGYLCLTAAHVLMELAASSSDLVWEQLLESALRDKLCTLDEVAELAVKVRGAQRVQRVLALRGDEPPTESLLETYAVQLFRGDKSIPKPTRQLEIRNEWGDFVGRPDLCWPEHGIFVELDGQGHKDQPVYDASRQTRIVVQTRWLPARFSWYEITRTPQTARRRLRSLFK